MIKVAHAKSGSYGVEVGLGDEGIDWEYAFALGSETFEVFKTSKV
jgi:hypothetical protein